MGTMSLYESGDSNGAVSLKDLFENKVENMVTNKLSLDDIANLILKGGWPENIENTPKDILDKEINEIDGIKRDKNKMEMLLKSLARNESTLASNKKLINDIIENEYD